jgi:pimeloyl-ACP methyl ester carboxylesterase
LVPRGHNAFGPTLAGHGKGASTSVTHAESTKSVVDFIVERELTDIVLVGHSYGGTIISKVAETIPKRVQRLVFLSAIVLNDGESNLDAFPPAQREVFRQLAAKSADNTVTLPFEVFRELFMNDADLNMARWAYDQLWPQSFQQLIEPLDLKKFYELHTPRSYLVGTEDVVMPPGEWGWHPRMSSRLGIYRLVQMPGGHELMFSNPDGLADKLIAAGRE